MAIHSVLTIIKGLQNLIEIAVGNILDNVLKYSTDAVDIETHEDNEQNIVISIRDRGPGIPEDRNDQVFQQLYRINKVTNTGFGLRLALVEQIMSVLNSSIRLKQPITQWAESNAHATDYRD